MTLSLLGAVRAGKSAKRISYREQVGRVKKKVARVSLSVGFSAKTGAPASLNPNCLDSAIKSRA